MLIKSTAHFLKYTVATLLGLGLVNGSAHAATISVNPTANANTLSNSILGEGITIQSVVYNGAPLASGTFTGGLSAGLGFDTGIILTTGRATNAAGPNNSDGATGSNNRPGDPDLSNLISGATTRDAASLVINFTTQTQESNLYFNYIFASEEYNEFVNSSFNDVFGFFLDGRNIATIPETTTPVAINTVNGGRPYGSTNATNPTLYNNNDPNDPGPASFDIQYDGFTDVFTAQALALTPGVHTIKLAIADTSDSILDSGVFIQGASFANTITPPVVPAPSPVTSTPTVVPAPSPVTSTPTAVPGPSPVTSTPTAVPGPEFSPVLSFLTLGAWGAMAQVKRKVGKRKALKVASMSKG